MICPAFQLVKLRVEFLRYTCAKGAARSTVRRFATLDAII